MAAVPVIINGVLMPKGRGAQDKPVPAVFIGYASIQGLSVGGGPIIPPGPDDPHPEHPIVLPPDPPIDVPPTDPGPQVAVVIKPAPVTGGWGLAMDPSGANLKWFFVPVAQPKGGGR